MALDVVLRETARDDLRAIFDWIEPEVGADRAKAYVQRIRDQCSDLCVFPNRGRPRSDLGDGFRTYVFERRALIVYLVSASEVQIIRILHHGRDSATAFAD